MSMTVYNIINKEKKMNKRFFGLVFVVTLGIGLSLLFTGCITTYSLRDAAKQAELNKDYYRAVKLYFRMLDHSSDNQSGTRGDMERALKLVDPYRRIDLYSMIIRKERHNESAFLGRAWTFLEMGEPLKARDDFERALAINPDYYNIVKFALPHTLVSTAAYLAYNGALGLTYDLAIMELTKAIELEPEYSAAYNSRGLCYFGKGSNATDSTQTDWYNLAIFDYNAALTFNPEYCYAYYNLGRIYEKQKDYTQATSNYNAALQIIPDNADYKDAFERVQQFAQGKAMLRSSPWGGSVVYYTAIDGNSVDRRLPFYLSEGIHDVTLRYSMTRYSNKDNTEEVTTTASAIIKNYFFAKGETYYPECSINGNVVSFKIVQQ
jgi:tetratricopeptide (TPR) repeat protein